MLLSGDAVRSESENTHDEAISFLAPPTSLHAQKKEGLASTIGSVLGPSCLTYAPGRDERSQSNAGVLFSDLDENSPASSSETDPMRGPFNDSSPLPSSKDENTILQSNLEALLGKEVLSSAQDEATLPICMYLLRCYFQIPAARFRPRQQEVCLSVLQRRHTLAVCPTGWGKSLCYQFPMLVYRLLFNAYYQQWEAQQRWREDAAPSSERAFNLVPPPCLHSKFCVVVSPLLSLMSDQAAAIRRTDCLRAFVFSSSTMVVAETEFFRELASPISSYDIVFVSPEKFISSVSFRRLLKEQKHRLAMICVDEAHCVSRWAYDFRPSFLYLNRILSEMVTDQPGQDPGRIALSTASIPVVSTTYLCLTATATRSVVNDLQDMFSIGHIVICTDQFRSNLILQSVDLVRLHADIYGIDSESERTEVRPTTRTLQTALADAVEELPKPLIVYVQSRADADELSTYLASKLRAKAPREGGSSCEPHASHLVFTDSRTRAYQRLNYDCQTSGSRLVVRSYHAGLSTQMRTNTQRQFINDQIDVLVATVAFGMGIDKRNVRSVVHAHASSSLESYVQEIGRAGRDGEQSYCRVLYNPYDFFTLRCRLWTSVLSPQEFQMIVQAILSNPFTQFGDKIMLVPVPKISQQLSVAEETVETVLFMILAHKDGELKEALRGIRGSCPLGFRVSHTLDPDVREEAHSSGFVGFNPSMRTSFSRKRARKAGKGVASTESGAVFHLLAQLQADDPVVELFNRHEVIENQVEAANEARLSWDEFTYRSADLIQNSNTLSLRPFSSGYIIELGPRFADVVSPVGIERVAQLLFVEYDSRLVSQVNFLKRLFRVLKQPTHESIYCALQEDAEADLPIANAAPGEGGSNDLSLWSPPPSSHTRVEAVSIVNSFVAENFSRLTSSYEAARCLLGVMPKSLIKHGKYAGQLPLSQSWYVRSPYFGTLREFDFRWVLAVLRPHNLDQVPKALMLHQYPHYAHCMDTEAKQ